MIDLLLHTPRREYLIFTLIPIGLIINAYFPEYRLVLLTIASFAAYPVVLKAFWSLLEWKLTMEVFYSFALVAVFADGDLYAGSFIVLMLAFARLVNHRMFLKVKDPSKHLLAHKVHHAVRENETVISTIATERVRPDDTVIVKPHEYIPVDGVVLFGKTSVDESVVTGSNEPQEKIVGDNVFASSYNLSQPIKIRATKIGKHSVLENMISLIKNGLHRVSREESFSQRFSIFFYPVVLVGGIAIYVLTADLMMVAALFLVLSSTQISPAIPNVVISAIHKGLQHGAIIRGSKAIQALSRSKILVLNKTSIVSYGEITISKTYITEGITEEDFWQAVAIGEKYSDHPIGKALFRESVKRIFSVPNAQKYQVYRGAGVFAKYGKDSIVIGNEAILKEYKMSFPRGFKKELESTYHQKPDKIIYVGINGSFVGYLAVSNTPPNSSTKMIERMRTLGFSRIVLLSGEKEVSTLHTADMLGISEYYYGLNDIEKSAYVERFSQTGPVMMIGDGVTDASILLKARVKIAVGKFGHALDADRADVILSHEHIAEIPDIVELSRRASAAMYGNATTWFVTNMVGVVLVFFGMHPWLAAFYKFATDFIPIVHAKRLYVGRRFNDII